MLASLNPFAFTLTPPSTLRGSHQAPSACNSPPNDDAVDQFEQYASRKSSTLSQQLSIARALSKRQRHHQVFLRPESEKPFRAAASRYVSLLREQPSRDERLWILHTRADPTFGKLRGPPVPARAMLMEPVGGRVGRWVEAIGRAGKVVSPYPSYFVDWGSVGAFDSAHSLTEGDLVACELLNANWTSENSVENMKDCMMEHAEEVVKNGTARSFEVLQSIDEPTVFKTVEVYRSLGDLQEHMQSLDKTFATEIMKWRAAVNRVRQLYEPLHCLHE